MAATSDGGPVPADRRQWIPLLPVLAVGAVVLAVQPFADAPLGEQATFVPVMLAMVGCFDVLSVVLLVGQFRDTGDRRALTLSWAYLVSLVLMLGWAAAFPGVFGEPAPFGAVASTAPWLWVAWHAAFPVLIGLALAPWPRAAARAVPYDRRPALAWGTVTASTAAALLLVAAVVTFADRLPVIITGTDTSEMTRVAGPVMLATVALATALTIVGAWRRPGPERWAGLAAAASLGDVVLTLFSYHRFSVGWYAGRTLTIVSAGVVLVALVGEFRGIKRRLAGEGERLRLLLDRTDRLEQLQHTLLRHMADGVVMQEPTGTIVASNATARFLLDLTRDEMQGRTSFDPRPRALQPDGSSWGRTETPPMITARTGVGRSGDIVGLHAADGSLRWLSLATAAVHGSSASVDYVVTTVSDVTAAHAAALSETQQRSERQRRIHRVLTEGGLVTVFQPIVELSTGRTIGAEALARFPGMPPRSPEQWFADAAAISLGVELELEAIREALAHLDELPAGVYLSLNAGPATVASPGLRQLLTSAVAGRVVLELTEHVGVEDYTDLAEALDQLRGLGVRLAVDDTGSGFASLQHILNLRPDIIKLDRALVTGIDTDPSRRALAGSLMTFAQEIGARVVAEGVENAREHTVLRRLGIRYGQGYHLGRPAPLPLPAGTPALAGALRAVPSS